MIIDIEKLKKIDWWNNTYCDLGKIKISIIDLDKPYIQDYATKPWDTAYKNITSNMFGTFPIAMQIVGEREKLTQKHRLVTITYDPQFAPINPPHVDKMLIDIPKKRSRRGTYGL